MNNDELAETIGPMMVNPIQQLEMITAFPTLLVVAFDHNLYTMLDMGRRSPCSTYTIEPFIRPGCHWPLFHGPFLWSDTKANEALTWIKHFKIQEAPKQLMQDHPSGKKAAKTREKATNTRRPWCHSTAPSTTSYPTSSQGLKEETLPPYHRIVTFRGDALVHLCIPSS